MTCPRQPWPTTPGPPSSHLRHPDHGRDQASTLTGSVIGLALLVIIVPICGALSDRLGRRKIFPIIGAIGMIVLFYPLLLLNQPGFGVYVLVAASGWVVLGIWQAVYPTIQAELFPASVRVSGIGFSHQLVIAAFGGTAPLIAAAFVAAGEEYRRPRDDVRQMGEKKPGNPAGFPTRTCPSPNGPSWNGSARRTPHCAWSVISQKTSGKSSTRRGSIARLGGPVRIRHR
jgi:Sugar (and other) transporter